MTSNHGDIEFKCPICIVTAHIKGTTLDLGEDKPHDIFRCGLCGTEFLISHTHIEGILKTISEL